MHKFRLVPGEMVHIGGMPYRVADDGIHLEGGTDPSKARSWRDDVKYEDDVEYETEPGRIYRPTED